MSRGWCGYVPFLDVFGVVAFAIEQRAAKINENPDTVTAGFSEMTAHSTVTSPSISVEEPTLVSFEPPLGNQAMKVNGNTQKVEQFNTEYGLYCTFFVSNNDDSLLSISRMEVEVVGYQPLESVEEMLDHPHGGGPGEFLFYWVDLGNEEHPYSAKLYDREAYSETWRDTFEDGFSGSFAPEDFVIEGYGTVDAYSNQGVNLWMRVKQVGYYRARILVTCVVGGIEIQTESPVFRFVILEPEQESEYIEKYLS